MEHAVQDRSAVMNLTQFVHVCGDCNEAIEREHRGLAVAGGSGEVAEIEPLVVDQLGWAKLPERGWVYNYDRCRIQHWPMPEAGGVAIQFIGGAAPGQATAVDDAVLFTVTRGALRDMIEHLQAVEASLEPSAPKLVPVA